MPAIAQLKYSHIRASTVRRNGPDSACQRFVTSVGMTMIASASSNPM